MQKNECDVQERKPKRIRWRKELVYIYASAKQERDEIQGRGIKKGLGGIFTTKMELT